MYQLVHFGSMIYLRAACQKMPHHIFIDPLLTTLHTCTQSSNNKINTMWHVIKIMVQVCMYNYICTVVAEMKA